MDITVSDAKAQLTDLVRRAEAGEDVVLTRFGQPVARIVPVAPRRTAAERRAVLDAARAAGRATARPGPAAARSADHLYDEHGLPT
jgi:prevent-host-death family protein